MECDWCLATLRSAGTVVWTETDDADDDELSEANSMGGGMMTGAGGGGSDDCGKPLSPLDECDGLPCVAPSPPPPAPWPPPTDELVESVDSDDRTLAVSSVTTRSRWVEPSPVDGCGCCSVLDSPESWRRTQDRCELSPAVVSVFGAAV